jgi:signal transduction histidine kinase
MSDGAYLIRHFQEISRELSSIPDMNLLYKRAVEGLQDLGFDRAALFLYDSMTNEMQGTWGTDERGRTIDESDYRSKVGPEKAHVTETLTMGRSMRVWKNLDLKVGDHVVGSGWNAMVVLQDSDRVFGMIFVDNLVSQKPLSRIEEEILTLYGGTVSTLILSRQFAALSEKYKAQNELKDKLFTILAHDLRGPIGNLSVTLGFACDQPMEHESLMGFLQEGRQASLRTYNLLENVLGWVRGQIEEVAALRERIPVVRTLVSVQVWLEAQAKTKGVRLVVECPENLTVIGDERMLETIIRNLVSNAVKYSPKGGNVYLRGLCTGGAIILEVKDEGIGMSPDKVAALFVSQQKKSQPGTNGEGGSGLGLMFSSDLARTLGGRLEAWSEVGKGSSFHLILPDHLDGDLCPDAF